MDSSTLYWITRFDGIRSAIVVLSGACVALTIALCVIASFELYDSYAVHSDPDKPAKRLALSRQLFAGASLCGLVAFIASTAKVLTPTTKEMAAILVLPALVEDEDAQEIGAGLVDLAKEWLGELKLQAGEEN